MSKTGRKTSKQILKGVTSGKKHLQDPKVVEKKNRRDLSKNRFGTDPQMEREVYKAIDWMREGKNIEWCTQELRRTINAKTGRVYAPRFVENIITAANQLIEMYYRSQIYQVEKVHIARYNKMIIDKLNRNYDEEFAYLIAEKPWVVEQIEQVDLMDVLQAMKQKEMLLGMHRKTFKVTINNQNNIFVQQPKAPPKPKLDISKLTLEEQVELLSLVQLTSRTEDEMHGVILSSPKLNDTIDIEAETIENDNVKYIEQFTKPKPSNESSTLFDIQTLIQKKLLDAAKNQPKR